MVEKEAAELGLQLNCNKFQLICSPRPIGDGYDVGQIDSLGISIPKSLVVWLGTTACKLFITSLCIEDLEAYVYALVEHVLQLAEDSAGIKHHIKIEHMFIWILHAQHAIKQSNSKCNSREVI